MLLGRCSDFLHSVAAVVSNSTTKRGLGLSEVEALRASNRGCGLRPESFHGLLNVRSGMRAQNQPGNDLHYHMHIILVCNVKYIILTVSTALGLPTGESFVIYTMHLGLHIKRVAITQILPICTLGSEVMRFASTGEGTMRGHKNGRCGTASESRQRPATTEILLLVP